MFLTINTILFLFQLNHFAYSLLEQRAKKLVSIFLLLFCYKILIIICFTFRMQQDG